MIIRVSNLVFYNEASEVCISGDWPGCVWLGCCENKKANQSKEYCYEASVDFLRWAIHPENGSTTTKVIYTDLWRFTKTELYHQVDYNTNLISFDNEY